MPLSLAEIERLRKFQLKIAGPELPIFTNTSESIHSDEPDPPSSPATATTYATRHWLPLEDLCPSLMIPRRMLRRLTHPKQLAEMLTIITIFSSSIDSVLKNIHGKQFLLRTDHIYTLLYASVLNANLDLTEYVETIAKADPRSTAEAMAAVMEFVETITRNLLFLHRTVEAFHREKMKALPDSPDEDLEEPDVPAEVTPFLLPSDEPPASIGDCGEPLPSDVPAVALLASNSHAPRLIQDDEKSLPPLPNEVDALLSDDPKASPSNEDSEQVITAPCDLWNEHGGKPLPESPVSDVTEFPFPSSQPPFGLIPDGGKLLPESPVSDATQSPRLFPRAPSRQNISKNPAAPTTPKVYRHKLIQRLLKLRAELSKPRTGQTNVMKSQKRSPLTVIDIDAALANSPVRSEPQEDQRYIVRQSFIYDRADPLCPDEKVDMPLPTGDSVAVRLDSDGDVKAASLPALIQLLTSHHALPVDEMCETFFLSFRLFSSPARLLAALQARWDEQPPNTGKPLKPAQQRVWAQHMCYVRNCLAQLLLTWLDDYWRPAEDGCVLARLRTFVVKRFKTADLVQGITTLVLNAIDRGAQEEHTSRAQRARDAEREGALPEAGPLNLVLRPQDDYRLNIAVFETTNGRERFAGQITALAHKHFRTLDPEAAVARWVTSEPTFFEIQKLEEAMLIWVAQSIVELPNREERVAMIEFWLDVATICVSLRNFSSASAIFGGLVFSPVERLSLTILDLAIPSKEQYRQLNKIFDGANNYAVYRRVLTANTYPAVPLIFVLRKDVISTNEISGPVALTNDPGAEKTLINFSAFRMLKKTICTMESCLVPYNIQSVAMIQDWIDKQLAVLPREEHETLIKRMESMSDQLEGRAPHPIKKGETWLQTVKGCIATREFTLHTLPDPGMVRPVPKLRKNKSIAPMLNLRVRAAK